MNHKFFFLLAFLLLLQFAFAHVDPNMVGHEQEHATDPIDYLPFDPFVLAFYSFLLLIGLCAISLAFQNSLSENVKKTFFIIVAISVGATTLYSAATTVYLNVISESGGPVHWHADFEIWECGQKITNLKTAGFPSNKVGSSVFHHHDDFRIHIEGLVIKKSDVSLQKFFQVIGGDFSGTTMSLVLQDNSIKTISNGQLCSGEQGKWRMYLKNHSTEQFEENQQLQNYVIKPEFNIPPGDFIKLVFDSKEGAPNGS